MYLALAKVVCDYMKNNIKKTFFMRKETKFGLKRLSEFRRWAFL